MTILLICDSCKEAVDKEKLLHILAYPKVKIKKSGYKSKLNMDICLDCYEQIFEINRKRGRG